MVSFTSTGIENLPFELQRNFNLMRDLDQRTEGETTAWTVVVFIQETTTITLYISGKTSRQTVDLRFMVLPWWYLV